MTSLFGMCFFCTSLALGHSKTRFKILYTLLWSGPQVFKYEIEGPVLFELPYMMGIFCRTLPFSDDTALLPKILWCPM